MMYQSWYLGLGVANRGVWFTAEGMHFCAIGTTKIQALDNADILLDSYNKSQHEINSRGVIH